MEGPSLVIATEEFEKYLDQPVQKATGVPALPLREIKRERLRQVTSWGKHFLLVFDTFALRVHFLMFGSYRINDPRVNRVPKLQLRISGDDIYFYSCAIKKIDRDLEAQYDWSNDIMASAWSSPKACRKLAAKPQKMICDLLMDQEIFSGVGNIMKNEILFQARMHPETRITQLDDPEIRAIVSLSRKYAKQFYKWKKLGELKRHWIVFRKKTCGECGSVVKKKPTGQLARMSHYCPRCQPKIK